MKIEYQRETFKEIIEEEFVSKKFDAFAYKEQLKNDARSEAGESDQFKWVLRDSIKGDMLDQLLAKSPFNKNSPEYYNLKKSIL